MTTHILCADTDPRWLEERRKRVTSSDMLCFLNRQPDWWSSSWDEIYHHKLEGTERELDLEGRVNVRHGSLAENRIVTELTPALLGYGATRHNFMYVHDRWPYLGATLDGILWPFRGAGPDLDLTTHTGQVAEVVERLDALAEPVLIEAKNARYPYKRKNGESNWIDVAPDYHIPQVQTAMHIADFHFCLLVGFLGGRDLSVHLFRRDPEWKDVLDEANERAGSLLARLW